MTGTKQKSISGGLRTKNLFHAVDTADQPLVSVITVTLNNLRQLKETVNSVLDQDFTNLEYLIIDGGSTDGTLEFLKSIEGRIALFISEPDAGIFDAINKGIALARGSIVNILNAGDSYAYSGVVSRYVELFRNHPQNNLIYANAHMINDDGTDFLEDEKPKILVGGSYGGRLYFCHQTVFYYRSLHDLLGPYTDKYRICADYHFWMKGYYQGKIHPTGLDGVTVNYRAGGPSAGIRGMRDQKRIEDEFIGRSLSSELLYVRKILLHVLRGSRPGYAILKGLRRIKHTVFGRPTNDGPTLP
jgi:glycosyltransferase involved in cell wall biosynthesis